MGQNHILPHFLLFQMAPSDHDHLSNPEEERKKEIYKFFANFLKKKKKKFLWNNFNLEIDIVNFTNNYREMASGTLT